MIFKTERLIITKFNIDMAESVSKLSLDEDNMRFMPDEVFETKEIAEEVINDLILCYEGNEGPFVYPILLDNQHIGHVELVNIGDSFEVGYHIGLPYVSMGYATEALKGFLLYVKDKFNLDKVYGICDFNNIKSKRVLEKSGFKLFYEGISLYHGKDTKVAKFIYEYK